MNWTGRQVLVTGAGGFIGSHLAEALVRKGAKVRAFLRYTSRPDLGLLRFADSETIGQMEIVRGDLRDADAIRAAAAGADTIFHLGALIGIPYSYVHPREVVDTNVIGTFNVLEAARAHAVRRLVHTSTSEVYGTALTKRISEQHRLQGQSPYSASKIAADKLVESYARSFGVSAVTIRPFNTYGPRQSARAIIPTIITQELAGGAVRLGSLAPTRDLTFVQDTVAGFLLGGEKDEATGLEINLGTDREVSIGDLVQKIGSILNTSMEVIQDPASVRPDKSEVMRLHADTTLAATVLGWRSAVPLEAGLEQTIDWIRQHADLYRPGTYEVSSPMTTSKAPTRESTSGEVPAIDAVVLVGGRGTRLAPYTADLPKPLVPIGGMPVLEILVRRLRASGVRRTVMAVGHLGSLITAHFGDGSRFGVSIDYSIEDQPLGTAGPLSLVGAVSDPFLVVNGDLLTDLDFRNMVRDHQASGALATIGLFAREERIELGVIETDATNRVTGYIEKPTYHYRASMGAYVFGRRVLDFVPAATRFDLPDLVRSLISAGEHVSGFEHTGYWLDIGRPADYERAQRDFETMSGRLFPAE